jgi:hypothetical protein
MNGQQPSLPIQLYGTEVPDVQGQTLRAGELSVVFENGALRYIRLGQTEVLRAIAFLVRDENWGTYAPAIDNLKIDQSESGFTVSYKATCSSANASIEYETQIIGKADGSLVFEAQAMPKADFLTNRTGFVVLHPLKGVAGCPLKVKHVDGRQVDSQFPAIIDPDCPFREIRSLTHEVSPGVWATCRMEGYAFEMEDHRNWTDASFKTYVRPLAEPWPYTMPAGEGFSQKVSLAFEGKLDSATGSAVANSNLTVSIGSELGAQMPLIGLGVPEEEAQHSLQLASLIQQAGPQLLVCQIDGRKSDGSAVATAYQQLGESIGADVVLEIIIPGAPGSDSPVKELAPIAKAVHEAGLKPSAVCVSPAPHMKSVPPGSTWPPCSTYEDIYRVTRQAFSGVQLGGGMISYFTELNRNRPPLEFLDYITHTTCPIVHAADDVSMMETLEALEFVIESTKHFSQGKAYRVGPSAIPSRDNPYGKATSENPDNGRVCLAKMDPRQRGLIGASWALGYIAAFAKANLEAVTIGAPTGPAGIIARKTDYPQPYFDDLDRTGLYPIYHIISGLAAAQGATILDTTSSDPAVLTVLGYQQKAQTTLWLGNKSSNSIEVSLTDCPATARLVLLDSGSFTDLTTNPAYLDKSGKSLPNKGSLTLGPYAVARITY